MKKFERAGLARFMLNNSERFFEQFKETNDLLRAWWEANGAPPHATEVALIDNEKLIKEMDSLVKEQTRGRL